ncbi:ABC-2 type transport system permease protein [Planomicrobium stackebrandtii]|uniref:ABC-2 type transport system permease protein n=1 Tax=Planomicrobium stackebrandtii TaxID=253160 RepID=A0ABU0GYP1_9BACL|nr:ABC transporter permease subunit [Planomicrobium stackebrandtii]MDQ0429682.1 ABC-2 type transport system permease protein [Planomicrobium stackebrandtii]
MLKLIQNEWMKLWNKKITWIMVILLVFIVFAGLGITKWMNSTGNQDIDESWQENTQAELASINLMMEEPGLSETQIDNYEEQIAIAEHRLENDIAPLEYASMQQQVLDTHMMMSLVTLLTVIVAASIVAAEFSQGTIKMLLTRPVKRWKILTSKYITVLLFAVLLTVILLISTALAGLIFLGIGEGTLLTWTGTEVAEASFWLEALKLAALKFSSIWMISTFAFMLGTVFRSSSLAIGLSIFLMFTGVQAVFFLQNYEIVKYYLFTHTDLTQFYTGNFLVPDITISMSLLVLAIYFLVFMAISYWTFGKRDVTA